MGRRVRAYNVAVNVVFPGSAWTTGADEAVAAKREMGIEANALRPDHVVPLVGFLALIRSVGTWYRAARKAGGRSVSTEGKAENACGGKTPLQVVQYSPRASLDSSRERPRKEATVPLDYYPSRGVGFSRLGVALSKNQMVGHIMQIESGTYKKAHRHAAGAQVIVLAGAGYSLMWPPGGAIVRVDWHKGSLVVPPENWYHHHFTQSLEPARHLALRRGLRGVGPLWLATVSEHEGGHLLEFEDEPPETRATYQGELAKKGVPYRMPPLAK